MIDCATIEWRRLIAKGRRAHATAMICFLSVLLSACALPVDELWPPSPASDLRTIYVSLDTWHAMIAFPQQEESLTLPETEQQAQSFPQSAKPGHSQVATHPPRFEEWGYAERAWYLEGRRGISGAVRALFWPTEGVVEVGWFDEVWAARTPQPPSDLFVFKVSEQGYRRLRSHLAATIRDQYPIATSDSSRFYPAKHTDHFFHTCHQYAAHSLREAGLPLAPFLAFSRSAFAWQLRRAARIAEKQPASDDYLQVSPQF